MILGVVNAQGLLSISLRLRGPAGAEEELEAVIDTGFTGALALPAVVVARLGLLFDREVQWRLADDTPVLLARYAVEIDWFGDFRPAFAVAVGDTPLVGTRLLAGHQLWAEFLAGGAVTVEPLP